MLETMQEDLFDNAIDRLNAGCERSMKFLREALEEICKAELKLLNAADEISETPDEDRIRSLMTTLENFECDVRSQIKRMECLT